MTLLDVLPLASGSTQRRVPEPYLPGLLSANDFLARRRSVRPLGVSIELMGVGPFDRPRWVGELERELSSLVVLTAGWDGRKARAISERALQSASITMVQVMGLSDDRLMPQVFPLPGGGVQLEWHIGGNDVEIEVNESGDVAVLVATVDGNIPYEGDVVGPSGTALLRNVSRVVGELSDRVASSCGDRR